jgi:asparagine synthase (glutamine-hydrolysing)
MCGAAGIVLNSSNQALAERLAAMARLMHHRGPDDEGFYVSADERVGLTNRRLAIRDLSAEGHMPMTDALKNTWITYNGEIYNANSLRQELERAGFIFHSLSDTEVILNGYLAWGSAIVERLRGMFAFAIYDARQGPQSAKILLARDQIGVKPLYYAHTSQAFVFASELRAVLASGFLRPSIDPVGIVGYLMFGSVPGPQTIYEGVKLLEPGAILELVSEEGRWRMTQRRYWFLPDHVAPPSNPSNVIEELRSLLEEAVRINLVSDAPLGAFLSGGLDSSAVVTLMRKATSGTIRTCSVTFEEADFDEARYAKAVAEFNHTEHFEQVIVAQDVLHEMDTILDSMDQPTMDGINTYFVSKTAREAGLKVALSGLGGDELFGGYASTFQSVQPLAKMLQFTQQIPFGSSLARTAIDFMPDRLRWVKVRDSLSRPPSLTSAYFVRRGLFAPSEVQALVSPEVWREAMTRFDPTLYINGSTDTAPVHKMNGSTHTDYFNWTSRAELSTYTQQQLLRDTDVMSMRHSLEVRVPLLDHVLTEYVLRLPAAEKIGGQRVKALLWKIIGPDLPPIVRERQNKQTFTFPFDRWLRDPLQQYSTLRDTQVEKLLRAPAIQNVWRSFQAGKLHWSRPWALFVLQNWLMRKQP